MKLLKRIIGIISSVSIALSSLTVWANEENFSDLKTDYECYNSVMRLSELGVINGYEDSTFRPWNNVTRAEFCKIVVAMMDKTTQAKSISNSSPFDDVNKVKWCIPYVNYLTSNNIIKGYADATFKPNNIITYAEAVTILCRILGYNEDSVGYSWPTNYLNEAEALKLAEDIQISANDSITRALMAIMADNVLLKNINGSSDVTFLESVGFTVKEDVFVLADSSDDSSLSSDEVRLTDGKYKTTTNRVFDMIGHKGTAVINKDKELVMFKTDSDNYVLDVVITKISGNTIEYKAKNSIKGTYTVSSDFEVYYSGNKTTYGAVASKLEVGTSVKLYADTPNEWDFAVVVDTSKNITPVRATKNYTENDTHLEGIEIDYNDLTVYKDNKTMSIADIEINDVVYYNTQTNTMDVYDKKVTGIYNEAIPSKAYIESVNVGGNVYNINSKVDKSSLDASNGSFEIGDRVTLLLGENDEVCFAVELSNSTSFDYGVLLKTYKETATSGEKEGSSRTMASIFMSDGNTYEYEISKTYPGYEGELVKIGYENGYTTLSRVTSSKTYGDVDYNKRTIGKKSFLKDAVIFQRLSDKDDSNILVEVVDFDTLGTNNISLSQLITSVSANAFGDILVMYVCDLPSSYKYGVLKGYESMGAEGTSGIYKIYTDSNNIEYQSDIKANVSGAVKFKVSNGKISDIKNLNKIAFSSSLNAVEGGRIMVNSIIYNMDDDVEIVNTNNTTYKTMSVNELAKSDISSITLYSDKAASDDTIIRLVMVTTK